MAKRFYSTDKFKDYWYRSLNSKEKLLWEFMLCDCNHAGIIYLDLPIASAYIGEQITSSDLAKFSDRIYQLKENLFLIPKFIKYQYNLLSYGNKATISVIDELKKNGVDLVKVGSSSNGNDLYELDDKYFNKTSSLVAPWQGATAAPSIGALDKDKEKEKELEKEKGESKRNLDLDLNLNLLAENLENSPLSQISPEPDSTDAPQSDKNLSKIDLNSKVIPTQGLGAKIDLKRNKRSKKNSCEIGAELDRIYLLYPRKEGKTAGMKKLKLSKDDLPDFEKAVKNYAEHCRYEKKPREYTKMFSTFCTDWKDWVDYEQEKSADDKILEVLAKAKRENAAAGIHDVEVNYDNGIDWLADDYNWEESCMK